MYNICIRTLRRGGAALRKHFREHDQKPFYQVKSEKVEISLELAKTRLPVGFESATYCNQETLSLKQYPLSHASLTTETNTSHE